MGNIWFRRTSRLQSSVALPKISSGRGSVRWPSSNTNKKETAYKKRKTQIKKENENETKENANKKRKCFEPSGPP